MKTKEKKQEGPLDKVIKFFTGLTLKENLKLRKLKKDLQQRKKDSRPDTSQDTIRFKKMFEDGVCLVEDGFYTMMIEFFDVNYGLLDINQQSNMLEDYSNFINYFKPGVKFELFLFNRRVPEESLRKCFEIEPQGDETDELREEFSEMLKEQNAKGTNGVIKSKYLIFGINAKSHEEAYGELLTIAGDIDNNLQKIGTSTKVLNGAERLLVLHDYYNQGTMSPFRFSYSDMAKSGHSIKDYIAPPAFYFEIASRFKMGNLFGSLYYVDFTCPKLKDEMLRGLLKLDDNITVTIHMETKDPAEAVKFLKKKLSDIQADKINAQKKAVRTGYDMDIIPSDINTYEQDTIGFLEDLNSSNQKVVQVLMIIGIYAETLEELKHLDQKVDGIIQQGRCSIVNLQYQQEKALNTASPIGCNLLGTSRDLPTKGVAVMIPFQTQELFMGGKSLYYGINRLSKNMIMADRKALRTPNGIILGTPGSGKSFAAKREMLMCYLITRDDVMICDPEGEYFPLVQSLGGQVIRLSSNSTDFINPLDIRADKGMKKSRFTELMRVKSSFIITLCDYIAGDTQKLNNLEKGIIDSCLDTLYGRYYENMAPENMPTLEDLQAELLQYQPAGIRDEMALDAKRSAVRIAQSLELYVHGSQNFFNHRTNVDTHNRMVCFDIRDLTDQLKELAMLIIQDAVWNRVSENRQKKTATRYYCDEFHLLLREEQTAKYMVEIWKRFRKWGGIPTGITQNIKDFFQSPQIEGILGNSDFIYLLNQAPEDQDILKTKLHLSNEQLKYVTGSEKGSGLILFDKVCIPFMDHFPENTKCYEVMNTKPQEDE